MPSHFLSVRNSQAQTNGVAFEIVSEAEIAQHFEERVVVRRTADIVDVTRAEAFLAGRGTRELQLDLAQKVRLELIHPGGSEQDRRVPGGDQHVAATASVAFGFEEAQIFFAKFVGFHGRGCRSQQDASSLCGGSEPSVIPEDDSRSLQDVLGLCIGIAPALGRR